MCVTLDGKFVLQQQIIVFINYFIFIMLVVSATKKE